MASKDKNTTQGTYFPYSDPSRYTSPDFNGKKKIKPMKIIMPILTVLVIAAIIVLNLNAIIGFTTKTFAPTQKYFEYVEKKAWLNGSDDDTPIAGFKPQFSIFVISEVINLITEYTGESIGIEDIADMGFMLRPDLERVVGGGAGNTQDATVEIHADDIAEQLESILPDNEATDSITKRYLDMLTDCGTVKKSTGEAAVDSLEKRVVALTLTLTKREFVDTSTDILTKMREDDDIKAILADYQTFLNTNFSSKKDVEKDFLLAIDSALADIQSDYADIDDDAPLFVLTDIVDNGHNIIGRTVTVNDKIIVSYMYVNRKNDFAFEGNIADTVNWLITGNKYEDALSGTGEITYNEESVITAEVSELDQTDPEGTVTLAPTDILISKSK